MVVFTCQHCNASLKRVLVAKHYTTVCRRQPHLTCIDCLKDFRGDDYNEHTTCVTEDERYGGADFKAKPMGLKQNEWLDVVHLCASKNVNPEFKTIFSSLAESTNVPRKKVKFLNFMKSFPYPKPPASVASQVFDIIEKEFQSKKKSNVEQSNSAENKNEANGKSKHENINGETDTGQNQKKVKKNKRKLDDSKPQADHSDEPDSKKRMKNKKGGSVLSQNSDKTKATKIAPINNVKKAQQSKNKQHKQSETNDHVIAKNNIENPNGNDVELMNKDKLSKKQLKKLKKKLQYEAELENIQKSKPNDVSTEEINTDDNKQSKDVKVVTKQNRKRKAGNSLSEDNCQKKTKIKNTNNALIEVKEEENIPEELNENQNSNQKKFRWEETIKEILRNSSDNEISVKKISKKVLAEYQAKIGDGKSYEQLISKFNKKIKQTPGVKVLKDKAKLVIKE